MVIEEIGKGSALEKAGLRPGDLLLSWEREGSQGEIRTPFDWIWVRNEQAPRGTVRLRGERDGADHSLRRDPGRRPPGQEPADRRGTAAQGRGRFPRADPVPGTLGGPRLVALPRPGRACVPGRYRLRIEGLNPDRTELLGEYLLDIEP